MLTTAPGALADVPVVLFDLDGTLVDSGPGILASLEHAFDVCGEELPAPEVLRTFLGPPLLTSFRRVLGLSEERAELMRLAYVEHYQGRGLLTATPYPGIPELLGALAGEGRTVAVATNKPETTARRLLEQQGLQGLFTLIGGTDAAVGRDDKAAVIGSVLGRLGVATAAADLPGAAADQHDAVDERPTGPAPGPQAPPSAVMIGDRIHDAHGAAEHGVPSLLVDWGYGGAIEAESELPRVGSVAELDRLLRR